ncbi:MAG TPA: hypothetical protein VMH38_08875 [Thermoplasmata archaeon]|nr:hypothetical protein [Thermoplasmata archaeon]
MESQPPQQAPRPGPSLKDYVGDYSHANPSRPHHAQSGLRAPSDSRRVFLDDGVESIDELEDFEFGPRDLSDRSNLLIERKSASLTFGRPALSTDATYRGAGADRR